MLFSGFPEAIDFFFIIQKMTDRKNKNDYTVICLLDNGKYFKLQYVHSVYAAWQWIERNIYSITHMNVYNRRSGQFIKQYKKGEYVDSKP